MVNKTNPSANTSASQCEIDVMISWCEAIVKYIMAVIKLVFACVHIAVIEWRHIFFVRTDYWVRAKAFKKTSRAVIYGVGFYAARGARYLSSGAVCIRLRSVLQTPALLLLIRKLRINRPHSKKLRLCYNVTQFNWLINHQVSVLVVGWISIIVSHCNSSKGRCTCSNNMPDVNGFPWNLLQLLQLKHELFIFSRNTFKILKLGLLKRDKLKVTIKWITDCFNNLLL